MVTVHDLATHGTCESREPPRARTQHALVEGLGAICDGCQAGAGDRADAKRGAGKGIVPRYVAEESILCIERIPPVVVDSRGSRAKTVGVSDHATILAFHDGQVARKPTAARLSLPQGTRVLHEPARQAHVSRLEALLALAGRGEKSGRTTGTAALESGRMAQGRPSLVISYLSMIQTGYIGRYLRKLS